MPGILSILGNSVPLLIPSRDGARHKTYPELLRERGYSVLNGCKQAAMASDLYRYLEDESFRHFPDCLILHFGIVECTRRARPRWLQHAFSLNDWSNSVVDSPFLSERRRMARSVLRRAYRPVERLIYSAGLAWRWLQPEEFRFIYADVILKASLLTGIRDILLVGLTSVSAELEARVPGTRASAREFDAVMRELARAKPNVHFLDAGAMKAPSRDGIHLTAEGHRELADMIQRTLVDTPAVEAP